MIEFACPHCQHSIKIQTQFAGRQGKCAKCGKVIVVPQLASPIANRLSAATARKSNASHPMSIDEAVEELLSTLPSAPVNGPVVTGAELSEELVQSVPPNPPSVAPTDHDRPPIANQLRPAGKAPYRELTHRNKSETARLFDWDAGVVSGLFDWKFRKFITPAIVSSLYSWNLLLAGVFLVAVLSSNFWLFLKSPARDSVYFYVSLVAFDLFCTVLAFLWMLAVRLCLEAVMVLFRSEEHLHAIADRQELSGE